MRAGCVLCAENLTNDLRFAVPCYMQYHVKSDQLYQSPLPDQNNEVIYRDYTACVTTQRSLIAQLVYLWIVAPFLFHPVPTTQAIIIKSDSPLPTSIHFLEKKIPKLQEHCTLFWTVADCERQSKYHILKIYCGIIFSEIIHHHFLVIGFFLFTMGDLQRPL